MIKKKHTYIDEIAPKRGFTITEDKKKVMWITGTAHYLDIPEKFKEKHVMKLWCEQNCQYPVIFFHDKINIMSRDFDHNTMQARMYFFSEEDAMAFKLRWL